MLYYDILAVLFYDSIIYDTTHNLYIYIYIHTSMLHAFVYPSSLSCDDVSKVRERRQRTTAPRGKLPALSSATSPLSGGKAATPPARWESHQRKVF